MIDRSWDVVLCCGFFCVYCVGGLFVVGGFLVCFFVVIGWCGGFSCVVEEVVVVVWDVGFWFVVFCVVGVCVDVVCVGRFIG